MRITVYGLPAPQGSKRHVGNGVMIESSKKVKPWREAVKWAAIEASHAQRAPDHQRIPGAIHLEVTFTMPKPKSAPKGRRTYPDRTPDLSKLVRSTEDALTDAGAWEDDARVIETISRKVFPNEHPKALHIPGALIEIRSAE